MESMRDDERSETRAKMFDNEKTVSADDTRAPAILRRREVVEEEKEALKAAKAKKKAKKKRTGLENLNLEQPLLFDMLANEGDSTPSGMGKVGSKTDQYEVTPDEKLKRTVGKAEGKEEGVIYEQSDVYYFLGGASLETLGYKDKKPDSKDELKEAMRIASGVDDKDDDAPTGVQHSLF